MLAVTRQEKIHEMILEKKTVHVSDVADLLDVSPETIRRDFTEMEKKGILKKIHGGAILVNRVESYTDNTMLKGIFKKNKRIIAKRAKNLIKDGDVIFLDSTTTSLQICECFTEFNITVISNSVDIINYLSNFDNINLIGLGGEYFPQNRCFIGKDTLDIVSNYHIDKAFISPRTIDLDAGVTHVNQNVVTLLQKVIKQSKYKVLAVDHSKFDKISLLKLTDFNSIDFLVTDLEMSEKWSKYLKNKKINFIDTDESNINDYFTG